MTFRGAAAARGCVHSRLLAWAGQWQSKDGTTHLIACRLVDMTPWLGAVAPRSRDFH